MSQLFGQRSYKSCTSLNYLIYLTRAWNFVFWKLELNTIYYADLNKLPFKYYISILGGGPEFGKTCFYNTCTLPNIQRSLIIKPSRNCEKVTFGYNRQPELVQVTKVSEENKNIWYVVCTTWIVSRGNDVLGTPCL